MKACIMTFGNLISEKEEINEKNETKVQECIDKWINAKNLPRKLKKKVRKQANKDYNFWLNLNEYYNNLFKI